MSGAEDLSSWSQPDGQAAAAPDLSSFSKPEDLSTWSNPTAVEAPSTSTLGTLIRHPKATLSDLASRFGEGFHAPTVTQQIGALGGDAGLAQDAGGGVAGQAAVDQRRDYDRSTAPRAGKSILEGGATLAGSLIGGLRDPTSYIAPEVKGVSLFKNQIINQLLGHGLGGAAAGMGIDTAAQGANLARDQQDKFSLSELGLSGLLQGGLGMLGHGAKVFQDTTRDLREAINPLAHGRTDAPDLSSYAKPAPKAAAAPQTANTLQDLWGRLIHQESGGDQGAVSNKGATGAAQLMPATAVDVANHIGRPDLATLALENSPAGRQANEYLGQVYLGQQLQAFDGDPALALAAYNAGPGRVREWLTKIGHPDAIGRGTWIDMIPFDETRNYVRSILGEHAGGAGKITPEMEQLRASLRGEAPAEAPAPEPTAAERAIATLGEEPAPAAAAPDLSAHAEPTEPHAGPVSGELTQDLHDFPYDREPAAPAEAAPEPAAPEPAALPSITDTALDHMRAGTSPKTATGPSLLEALVKEGGVRDEGGELTNILGGQGQDRMLKMLRRVKTGKTLDEAALWAQERGYIGGNLDQGHPRVEPGELLEAIRREVAGDKVYPEHALDHHAQMISDHMQDLEEMLSHLGMDPRTHSNAEIRAAMDRMFAEPEHVPEHLGIGGEGLHGGGGAEAVARARAARDRLAQREELAAMIDPSTDGARLHGNRQAGAVPMPGPDVALTPIEASFADIWRNLKEALDVPVRAGRIGMRKALGTYNRKTGVVRVKGVHDVGVETHELAHAMEFTKKYPTLLAEMAKHSKTLKAMDYDPKAARRHEGFAEFVRWYVVNPEYARQRAPLFYDAFEHAMAKDDPKAFEALKLAQGHYDAFLNAPSLQSAGASIVRRRDISLAHSFANVVRDRGLKEGVGMLWHQAANEAYRGVVDYLHPWKQAVDELLDVAARNGKSTRLLAAYDPYKLLRQIPAVYNAGHMDLIHGVHPYQELEPESASLAEALQLALGDKFTDWDTGRESLANQFDAYLIGRRVRHDYDRIGQEGGLTQPPDQYSREYWERVVHDAEQLHPEWAQAAEMIYDWNNALWKKRHAAGFISDDDYVNGLANNPDYVPLYRDLSDTKGVAGGPGSLDNKYAGGVKRRRGSTRGYMSPLESMMQHAYTLNAQIARNDALKALDDMGRIYGPDAGRVVERLKPKDVKPLRVGVQEVIENAAREHGLNRMDRKIIIQSIDDLFGEDASTRVYRAEDMRENGEPILYVWRNGERIPLRLPDGKWGKHMVEAFAGTTPAMRGMMFDLAAIPARLIRVGTTVHPAFFLSNTVRDQVTAGLLTDVGYRPFYDQARGVGNEVTQSDLTRHYNVAGGEVGGMQSAAERDGRMTADINVLRRRGARIRHFANWQGLAHAVELSETGTRMGLFDRGVRKFSDEGMTDWEAAKEAAFQARDYMDFDRHGGWPGVRAAMRLIPFMNAATQALDKVIRVAGGGTMNAAKAGLSDALSAAGVQPGAAILKTLSHTPVTRQEQAAFDNALKLWIGVSALATGSLALRAAYKNNPEFDEVSDYIRNTGWAIPLPGGSFGIIPKPYEIASPGNALERVYEAVTQHDPTAIGRLLEGLETQLTPNHDAPIFSIPFQLARNRDTFGSPIVPDQLQNVDPQFQYTDRTSGLAKGIGEMTAGLPDVFGMRQSPAKVDFLIKSLFSSLGRDALALTKRGEAPIAGSLPDTPVASRFVKDWTRGANSTKEFYSLVSSTSGEWSAGVNSVQKLVKDGDVDKAVQYIGKMPPEQKAYTVLQLLGEGGDKDAHPMVRAQKISSALQSMAFEIQQGDLKIGTPQGLQTVKVTPDQRREAVDALHRMAVAEQRNAMIVAQVKGWGQRPPLPYDKYAMALNAANPALGTVLGQRLQLVDQHLQPAAQTYAAWRELGPRIAAVPPEVIKNALIEKNGKGRAGALRALEEVTPVK